MDRGSVLHCCYPVPQSTESDACSPCPLKPHQRVHQGHCVLDGANSIKDTFPGSMICIDYKERCFLEGEELPHLKSKNIFTQYHFPVKQCSTFFTDLDANAVVRPFKLKSRSIKIKSS